MQNQLLQICKAFFSQFYPAITAAVFLGVLLLLFFPRTPATWGTIDHFPTLSSYNDKKTQRFEHRENLTSKTNKPITSLTSLRQDTESLWIDGPPLSDSAAAQIQTLENLQQLFLAVDDVPHGLLISHAAHLKELKIRSILLQKQQKELHSLTHLELLITDNQYLTPQVLQSIAKIPNLKSLVVIEPFNAIYNHSYDSANPNSITLGASDFAALLQRPRPLTVYANWSENSELPRLYPTSIFRMNVTAAPQVMTTYAWMVMIFGWLLVSEFAFELFARPTARLTPDFLAPHYLFLMIVAVFLLFLCILAFQTAGVPVLPALATCLIPVTIYATYDLFVPRSPSPTPLRGRNQIFSLLFLFITFLWMGPNIAPRFMSLFQNFLEGQFPSIAATSNIIQFAFIIVATTITTRRLRLANDPHPLLHSRLIRKQHSEPIHLNHTFAYSLWQQACQLRKRNKISILGANSPWVLLSFFLLFKAPESSLTLPPIFIGAIFPALILIQMFSWGERKSSLAIDTLRPYSRKRFTKVLFTSIAIDHILIVLGPLTLLLIGLLIPSTSPFFRNLFFLIPTIWMLTSFAYLCNITTLTWPPIPKAICNALLLVCFIPASAPVAISLSTSSPSQLLGLAIIAFIITTPFFVILTFITYVNSIDHEWGNSQI